MNHAQAVLRTVERLYAAALTPEAWPAAMEGLIDLLGGEHAIMHARSSDDIPVIVSGGLQQRDFERFLCAEAVFWSMPVARAIPVGIAVSREQIQNDRDFARSAFWNEIVRPVNGFHSVTLRHERPVRSFLISVCRSQQAGGFDATGTSIMQALDPHIATALDFRFRLDAAEQCAGISRMLDRLDAGAILTDACGQPLHMNGQAARITMERDGLTVEAAGLAAAIPAQTQRLRAAIAAVAADTAGEGRWLRLDRPSCRAALVVTVLPVWRLGALVPGAGTPRVALFIKEPDTPPTFDPVAIADAFRLTGRESEIAALLAGGRDLREIATALGLGLGTVRFHLKRVFDKTGARNQAGLVALIRNVMEVCVRP